MAAQHELMQEAIIGLLYEVSKDHSRPGNPKAINQLTSDGILHGRYFAQGGGRVGEVSHSPTTLPGLKDFFRNGHAIFISQILEQEGSAKNRYIWLPTSYYQEENLPAIEATYDWSIAQAWSDLGGAIRGETDQSSDGWHMTQESMEMAAFSYLHKIGAKALDGVQLPWHDRESAPRYLNEIGLSEPQELAL
jgi:hypothetical protein